MKNEMVWVIKKGEYFVNPKFRALFSGITSGFTGYTNEQTMLKDLEILGADYYSEFINLRDIPDGKRIYDMVRIEDATFWVCGEIPINMQGLRNCLTPGRFYGLLYDQERDEYYFHDNQGNNVNYFLVVPGKFIQ